jgi:phenylacetate-CoA ligase
LLPYFAKGYAATAYGLLQRRDRYGKDFLKAQHFLRESQYWSLEDLRSFQKKELEKFLFFAARNSAYYRKRISYHEAANIDISQLPVLFKPEVKQNINAIVPDNISSMRHRTWHTSGTTGSSLVFPLTYQCFEREYAFRAMHYEWGGVSLTNRDRIVACSGHPIAHYDKQVPPFWVYDRANNWLFFSSYHLSPRNIRHYIVEIDKFKPQALVGYPSSLYLLALGYTKYGNDSINIKSIFTSSETLFGFQRSAIERSFRAKVFDWYGNSEMCANIVQCEEGEMHLKLEHSFVEILNDNNGDCLPGQTGGLVCTGFGNYAFPLIRYAIGDVVTLSENQTPKCGRGGILIDRVEGRDEDYVITPDGRLLGRLDHLFKDSENVIEAQIQQDVPTEVTIRIVRGAKYGIKDEREIQAQARLRFGSGMNLVFEYVDSIPRSASGKFCFVKTSLGLRETIGNGKGEGILE